MPYPYLSYPFVTTSSTTNYTGYALSRNYRANTYYPQNYIITTTGNTITTTEHRPQSYFRAYPYQAPQQQTYSDDAWYQWVQSSQTYGYPSQFHVETPEETEARRVERERERQDRHAARTRARVLLGEFLSDDQKGELERNGRFHVTGSKGRRYCIRTTGQAGNVDLLKPDGSVQATLCAHPGSYLPDGDAWLMQMIELRHDEDHFLSTANVHRGSLAGCL